MSTISVYAIAVKEGKILLTQDVGKKGYKIPGGKVEEGELLHEALKREFKEETGLDIYTGKVIFLDEYINDAGTHRLRFYFYGTIKGGEERRMEGEVESLIWYEIKSLDELTSQDFYLETYYQAVQSFINQNNDKSQYEENTKTARGMGIDRKRT